MTKTPPMAEGQKYNRLTAIEFSRKSSVPSPSHDYWWFLCECGEVTESKACHVKSGGKQSCGCVLTEILVARNTVHNLSKATEYEYTLWQNMKNRCTNPNYHSYHRYGGRGIKVCSEWNDFAVFYTYLLTLGDRPSLDHSIDRIKNDEDYKPGNLRWATAKEQANNRV